MTTPTEARQLIDEARAVQWTLGRDVEQPLELRLADALEAFLPTDETETRYTPQEVADYAKSCNVLDFKPVVGQQSTRSGDDRVRVLGSGDTQDGALPKLRARRACPGEAQEPTT